MSTFPVVLTVESAAERLVTTPEHVQAELEAGRLDGFRLGDQWRTTDAALLKFIGVAPNNHGEPAALIPERRSFDVPAAVKSLEWSDIGTFTYNWQVEGTLAYEGREAKLQVGRRETSLPIGLRTQEFAGDKDRLRSLSFSWVARRVLLCWWSSQVKTPQISAAPAAWPASLNTPVAKGMCALVTRFPVSMQTYQLISIQIW